MSSSESSNSPSERIDLIVESVLEEMQRGEQPDLAAINQSHSDLQPQLQNRLETLRRLFVMVESAEDEVSVELAADCLTAKTPDGRALDFAHGVQQLPCPHCGVGIKLVDNDIDLVQQQEVTCRNCGSSVQFSSARALDNSSYSLQLNSLGRFSLHEVIGSGGFGVVYRAFDTELDRQVAIKLPREGTFHNPEDKQRFLREARHVAQLRHPNIVAIHEIGHDIETPYIVSEYIDGLTLNDLINNRGMDAFESAELMAKVADAVHYAHQQKIVHRDLKPSNILLDHELEPFVTDFGLAKLEESAEYTLTLDGQIIGTPSYMSPEQVRGQNSQVDRRSDIYSLGVVFYRMLTGELPFRGSKKLMLHQIQYSDPRSPRTLNDRIPKDLETIALKAMEKDVGKRYQTCQDLAEDLRRAVRREPISARPIGGLERSVRWCRRHPSIATLAGLVTLLLVVTAIGATMWSLREHQVRVDAEQQEIETAESAVDEFQRAGTLLLEDLNPLASLAKFGSSNQLLAKHFPKQLAKNRQRLGAILAVCPNLVSLQTSETAPNMVRFSNDQRMAVSVFRDRRVVAWDIAEDRKLVDYRHTQAIRRMAISPNDRYLAVACQDYSITVLDLQSGREVGRSARHENFVNQIIFDSESKYLLSCSDDNTARAWAFNEGPSELVFRHDLRVKEIILLPDAGRFMTLQYALLDTPSLKVWDLNEPAQPLMTYRHDVADRFSNLTVNSSQNQLFGIEWSKGGVLIWNLDDLTLSAKHEYSGVINQVRSSDSGWICLTQDNKVLSWDLGAKQPSMVAQLDESMTNVWGWSADGKRLVASDTRNRVWLWDLQTNATTIAPIPIRSTVSDAVLSERGRYLMIGARNGTVTVWDCLSEIPPRRLLVDKSKVGRTVVSAISKDTQFLAWVDPDNREVLNIGRIDDPNPQHQIELPNSIREVVFSNDGRLLLAACKNEGFFIDVRLGQQVHQTITVTDALTSAKFFPDDKRLLAVNSKTLIQRGQAEVFDFPDQISMFIWDVETGQRSPTMSLDNLVRKTHIHPSGDFLATICADQSFEVWNADSFRSETGELNQKLGNGQAIDFSPNENLLATASDTVSEVALWGFAKDQPAIRSMDFEFTPRSLRYHPDGSLCVGFSDGRVRILNEQLQVLRSFQTNGEYISDLHFEKQGSWVVSLANRRYVKTPNQCMKHQMAQLWDYESAAALGPVYCLPEPIVHARLNPDCNKLVLLGRSGLLAQFTLPSEDSDLAVLNDLCSLLSGVQLNEVGQPDLTSDGYQELWQRLKNNHPKVAPQSYSPDRMSSETAEE